MRQLACALSAAVLTSCGNSVGPCSFDIRSKIVEITRATDSQSGVVIAELLLTDFSYRGTPIADPADRIGMGHGLVARGDTLVCTTPCSFGDTPGVFSFTVSAVNYEQKRVHVDADWLRGEEGCPGWADGATQVNITLQGTP